jgi:hypothetical protein
MGALILQQLFNFTVSSFSCFSASVAFIFDLVDFALLPLRTKINKDACSRTAPV